MSSFESLVAQLADPDKDIVIAAAHALGDAGDRRAVPILITLLETTDNQWIRNAAAVGLRELRDARALPALVRQIRRLGAQGDVGTLVYALHPFADQSPLLDLAEITAGYGYEAAHMATDAIIAMTVELLPHETSAQAIRILQAALDRPGVENWRIRMIIAAIDHLEDEL